MIYTSASVAVSCLHSMWQTRRVYSELSMFLSVALQYNINFKIFHCFMPSDKAAVAVIDSLCVYRTVRTIYTRNCLKQQ